MDTIISQKGKLILDRRMPVLVLLGPPVDSDRVLFIPCTSGCYIYILPHHHQPWPPPVALACYHLPICSPLSFFWCNHIKSHQLFFIPLCLQPVRRLLQFSNSNEIKKKKFFGIWKLKDVHLTTDFHFVGHDLQKESSRWVSKTSKTRSAVPVSLHVVWTRNTHHYI